MTSAANQWSDHVKEEAVMDRTMVVKILAAVLSGALPLSAVAQGMAGYSAQTVIDGNVGSDAQGVLGVNTAAGDSNLQNNSVSTAISSAGTAAARANVVQTIDGGSFSVPDVAVAKIDGNAFNNAAGSIGINQAAGAANAQANSVAIAVGVNAEVTADAELAQSISGVAPATLNVKGHYRETTVADTAFRGAHGIVQVNQSAGFANATGNSFALRVQLGGPQ